MSRAEATIAGNVRRTGSCHPLVLGVALALVLGGVASPAVRAARPVPNFQLLDLGGHNRELYRAESPVVVLFFTGVGCPVARKSAAKLREFRDHFEARGAALWIINSYPADTAKDCRKEVAELDLHGFPYLRDPHQGVALALGVERTSEVVAIGTRDWRVFYQGAIDDQLSEGAERATPHTRPLQDAVAQFLDGKPVQVPHTDARGCRLTFAKSAEGDQPVDYDREVAPVLRQHCVGCHREGAIAPWAMDGHARVRNYSRMIEEVLLTRRMPPWDPDPDVGHFANAQTLTREEIQTLLRWVSSGSPAGRGQDPDPLAEALPPLPEWPLGKPDVVLRLPEPQPIPATGVLEYRHVPIPFPFTNEVWLSGMDIKPGNRRVVHHVILYAKWPGCPDDGTGKGMFVCGWAPGSPGARYPGGVARRLPANTALNMEVHYSTCGSPQTDQSEIALYLAPGPQPREISVRAATETDVHIPPGSDEARHTAVYAFQKAATIYSLSPHMHVRGSWMRYELLLPDGTRETLLHVPRYDFNWQFRYQLAQPRLVPAGAWLLVTGAFDNAAGKGANPDSQKRVRFGLQSWEEMFIGFFEAVDEPELALSNHPPAGNRP